MTMKIYLTNLGKYNEGELVGEWVSLPVDEEELNAVFDRIMICHDDKMYYDEVGCPYEEYFITDYECDFCQIGEYEDLDSLNEMAEELESLDDDQEEIVKITENELTGYDAVRKILIVDMTSATAGGQYTATVRPYTVVPSSNGDTTDCMTYSGDFKSRGTKKTVKVTLDDDCENATIVVGNTVAETSASQSTAVKK